MVKNFVKQKLFLWFGLVFKLHFGPSWALGWVPTLTTGPGSREGGKLKEQMLLFGVGGFRPLRAWRA